MNPFSFKSRDFVHLHLHTDYSLLQSTIQLKPLVKRLCELEMQACAISDYGNMYGAVSFYNSMRSAGIRPILGYEAFVAGGSRFDRTSAVQSGEKPYYNLVLLAKDLAGYHNLVHLSSKAFTEGFHHKARIDLDILAAHSEGLIALSAGFDGSVAHYLKNGNTEKALETAKNLESIFGSGNFYLEIGDHGTDADANNSKATVELSKASGIPMVAANDSHYLNEADSRAHEVMLCIGEGRTLSESGQGFLPTSKYYVRSAEEMWQLFGSELPESLTNTMKIAEMCDVSLPVGDDNLILPNYPIPADSKCTDLVSYFEEKVAEGFEERKQAVLLPMQSSGTLKYDLEGYQNRLDREIGIIEKMGYEGYFLIVWDFIKYAVQKNIPVGPGRGSAAGSLVAYCLGITGIDPLQYDLLFERFLNPERVSMPDIDIDFCIRGRGDVINHVTEVYGRDSVCQIITFGTMASRAAIKDVGRALNMPYGDVERIAKLIPPPIRGRNVSISQALETVSELKDATKDPKVKDLIDLALRLEGCSRHSSVHAAGVVISPKPLHELVPVAMSSKNELTSQYSMNDLEKVGMLKMDFLALTTLTVINDCLASLQEKGGVEIDWSQISLNDEKTMELFGDGRTDAIFQFESSGMQEICRRLKPKELEDLSALNALYRPGPIDGGMIEDFIQRHRGDKPVRYLIPEMKDILSNTYGVLVYQEQIMQLAQKLAGYTLGEADMMRRAMGKKKREDMAKEEIKFIDGAIANNIKRDKAEAIFKLMAQFADYGFNRSHSIAYAYLAFQTGYLKAHYPSYFFASVLSHESDDSAKVYKYSSELRSMGLSLLPPDINESDDSFTPSSDSVRFGLNAIKGIATATITAIVEARKTGKFTSLFDFASRIDQGAIGKRGLENLIAAGAFDSLMPPDTEANLWRARLFAGIDDALSYSQRAWNDKLSGQHGLFGGNDSQESLADVNLPNVDPWSQSELSRQEKAAIGFYLSAHPIDEYVGVLSGLKILNIADHEEIKPGDNLTLAGIVSGAQIKYSKKGNRFCVFRLEDRSSGVKGLMWAEAFGKYGDLIKNDALLVVEGRVESADGNEITFIASEVRSLLDAEPRNARGLSIALPKQDFDDDYLFGLFSILSRTHGMCEVSINIPADLVDVRLQTPAFRVQGSSALENDLKQKGCSVSWIL